VAVEHPRAGVEYPRNWHELLECFPDDASCLRYLERLRWGDGFVCRFCGTVGGGWWQMADGLRRCAACRGETSVSAGTIFAGTRTPLVSWFAAVWYVVNQKQGVSALGLQRVLGLGSYQTAWAWLHKLRRAMVRPGRELLDGVVEVDETVLGGVKPGDPAHVAMPEVHRVASLLKRWLLGTHQGAVSHDRLDYYLDESTFRFNRRRARHRGLLFYRLLEGAVATDPHPYKTLTSESAA
jgi:Transposase zinc-ribbon domain/ISXO2-like transposase domain